MMWLLPAPCPVPPPSTCSTRISPGAASPTVRRRPSKHHRRSSPVPLFHEIPDAQSFSLRPRRCHPGRIKRAVYLDAFLPENGESVYSSMGPEAAAHRRPAVNGFISLGDQTGKPVPHVVPQSEKTFTEPIKLEQQDAARAIPTTYIL